MKDFEIKNGVLVKYTGDDKVVIIPDSVTSIGARAFAWNQSPVSIVIPDGVNCIGNSAFRHCENLVSITIPDSVTSIGDCAFVGCKSLTSVYIPAGLSEFSKTDFFLCSSLKCFTVSCENQHYSSDEFGVLFDKDKKILLMCPVHNRKTHYRVPDSVVSIGDGAFRKCGLESITLSDKVTNIGVRAFEGCKNMGSITLLMH